MLKIPPDAPVKGVCIPPPDCNFVKLLLVSDLHCDPAKLDWIAEHASAFDLVSVAGDLLNIFMPADSSWQEWMILKWKARVLASGASLIWCSGNHDFFHGEDSPILRASPQWMCGSESGFVDDGKTALLRTRSGTIAVTTIPWPVTGADVSVGGRFVPYVDYVASLLEAGKKFQADYPWLVLFHEPPLETRLCVDYAAMEGRFARQLIEKWEPDWSLHGHVHESVANPDGDFFDRLGRTTCFNAGQSPEGDEPHCIILHLDGCDWRAKWTGAGEHRSIEGTRSTAH